IIIISAKDEEIDKILGLELGGDDYLTKPFSPRELVARVKRLFKRTQNVNSNNNDDMTPDRLKLNRLLIDRNERRVFWEGEEQDVTTKEFDMLLLFAENTNRAFSREELLIKGWGEDYFGSDRAVDDLVTCLRKQIASLTLQNAGGLSYRLRPDDE